MDVRLYVWNFSPFYRTLSKGSEGQLGLEGLPEWSEGLPQGSLGLSEGSEGLPEGP